MKFIVLFALIIALIIGICISLFLFTYNKELVALPIVNAGSEDEQEQKKDDKLFKIAFYVSLLINFLYLTSCTIIVFI